MEDNRAIQPKGDTTVSDRVVDVEYKEVNKPTSEKLTQAGEKIKQSTMSDNMKNFGKTMGKVGKGIGKVAGATVNVGSQFAKGYNEARGSLNQDKIRSNISANTRATQSGSMSSGVLDLARLPPTPAKRQGQSGRPQTKVVIKKNGLLGIGGTEEDFEKLITLEELTKGRVPMQPVGAMPPPQASQPPSLQIGGTGAGVETLQKFTQRGEASPTKLREFVTPATQDMSSPVSKMRDFTIPATQASNPNVNKMKEFTSGMSKRDRAMNKLRRFL